MDKVLGRGQSSTTKRRGFQLGWDSVHVYDAF